MPCCDLCAPTLLNRTRPGPPEKTPKKANIKSGLVNEKTQNALLDWRKKVWQEDFADMIFGPSSILSDETVDMLSSVGPVLRLNVLERIVGSEWPWFGRYGNQLLDYLISLNIPPMQPKPQQKRAAKRAAGDPADNHGEAEKGNDTVAMKKSRIELPLNTSNSLFPRNPTPVTNHQPSTSQLSSHPAVARIPPAMPHYPYMQYMNYSSPIQPNYFSTPQRPVLIPPHMTHMTPHHPTSSSTTSTASSSSQQPNPSFTHYSFPPSMGYNHYQTPIRGPFMQYPGPSGSFQPPSSDI